MTLYQAPWLKAQEKEEKSEKKELLVIKDSTRSVLRCCIDRNFQRNIQPPSTSHSHRCSCKNNVLRTKTLLSLGIGKQMCRIGKVIDLIYGFYSPILPLFLCKISFLLLYGDCLLHQTRLRVIATLRHIALIDYIV